MPRRNLIFSVNEYYHLYNRGNNRDPIFYDRENYLFFLQRVHDYIIPTLEIVAYCLMSNHYHLLVRIKNCKTSEVSETSEVSAKASEALKLFSISYTKAMNKRYDRVGSLFQGAFQAKHIGTDRYLLHFSRYIHINPVVANLVNHPEDWEFSSYSDYIGNRNGNLPKTEIVLSQFPSRQTYQEFAESYTPKDLDIIGGLLFD